MVDSGGMMSIQRSEHYDETGLVEVIELEDVGDTVRYRRTVQDVIVEDRPAVGDELAEWATAVKDAKVHDIDSGFADGIRTLRTWAADAQNVTVTSANAVTVLGVTVNRLGLFFDRFADLLVLLDRADPDDFE